MERLGTPLDEIGDRLGASDRPDDTIATLQQLLRQLAAEAAGHEAVLTPILEG